VTVIAAAEGAVALCRAERSKGPFEDVETVLLTIVKSLDAQQVRDDTVKRKTQ
jgi:hypothetical protein